MPTGHLRLSAAGAANGLTKEETVDAYRRQTVALTGGALLVAVCLLGLSAFTYLRTVDAWEKQQQQQRDEVSWDWDLPTLPEEHAAPSGRP